MYSFCIPSWTINTICLNGMYPDHLPPFILHNLHVIKAPSVESTVRYCTPEITPHFVWPDQ